MIDSRRALQWLLTICLCGQTVGVLRAEDEVSFERDIRPILSDKCFYCHGQDANQRQGDLRLDVREAAIEAGAIAPHDLQGSGLLGRINATDVDELMPPADSNRSLSTEQKQLLQRWIAQGAVYESHWAFVAPQRPQLPRVQDTTWASNPIDQFVLAKLEQVQREGVELAPASEADRETLIKRLSIDLTGLPPTPQEVAAFVDDQRIGAYERLVDRLLESPHYGERMSLPWLDAARYADSNGFQQDGDTWQWMWRDWVVRALNDDLPFDQFTTWQLAGDLLPNPTTEQLIASGFNRNHLLNGEGGAIAEEQRFVILFDRIDTTATTWLGLTMACAQCHDHKYDPITRRDYYSFMDAFNRVPESGVPGYQSPRIRVAPPFIELPTPANTARLSELEAARTKAAAELQPVLNAAFTAWRIGLFADGQAADAKDLPEGLVAVLEKAEAARSPEDQSAIETQLRQYFDAKVKSEVLSGVPQADAYNAARQAYDAYNGDQIPRVMIMSDDKPRETHILDRGEYLKPTDLVAFATPEFLPALPEGAPRNRLGLAQWLTAPEQPLTARVQVNRAWQHFFGQGLVKTAEDFGVQSEYPVHKDLLDWLAVEFQESGWSMKHMHRLIVTSTTYRQSSRVTAEQREADLENRLLARASRFRMPAMLLRDWALASSGLLEAELAGAPVYPYQPEAVWESLAITKERDFTYPQSSEADLYRRSLYTFWRRTVSPANMFDASNRQACRVRLATTSTPLHALTTLNDPTWVEAARVLAGQCMQAEATVDQRLIAAFRQVVCRAPDARDLARLRAAYGKQFEFYSNDSSSAAELLQVGHAPTDESIDVSEQAALTAVCLAIFNLDEALTRE